MPENAHEIFVAFYHETYDALLKYVISKCSNVHDASDIIQRTYLNYYERLKKSKKIDNPASYLFRIAKNETNRYYRFKYRHKDDIPIFSKTEDCDYESLEMLLAADVSEDAGLDTREIWQYIKNSDPLTFQIFVLYFYYDEKLSNIAKTLSISESTVKNRLYRTINQMKKQFRLSDQPEEEAEHVF